MEPMRDADARIRALTREVGSLREDLRREVKRRERAVAQAQQHEAASTTAQAKLQELGYANRKLASDLDAAHEAARKAADRDKRALQRLREGLCTVEQEVQARGQQGCQLVAAIKSNLTELRALLSDPAAYPMGQLQAQQVRACITAALAGVMDLADCLTGGATSGVPTTAADAASGKVAGAVSSRLEAAEQQQAQDEISRLRSELRAVVDKAAGAAGAASLELQSMLRSSQAEASDLRRDTHQLQAALQASEERAAGLQARVESLQTKLAAHESAGQQAAVTVDQLAALRSATEDQVAALREANTHWQQHYQEAANENSQLKAEVQRLGRELSEAGRKLEALQYSIHEQQQDMQAAMQLVARPHTAQRTTSYLPRTHATHTTHAVSSLLPASVLGPRPGLSGLGTADLGPRPGSAGPPGVYSSAATIRPRPVSAAGPSNYGAPSSSLFSFQHLGPNHGSPHRSETAATTTATRHQLPPDPASPSVAAKAAAAHHLLKSQLPGFTHHTSHMLSPRVAAPTWPLTSSTSYNVSQQPGAGASTSKTSHTTTTAAHGGSPGGTAYVTDKATAAATAAAVAARLRAQQVLAAAAAARSSAQPAGVDGPVLNQRPTLNRGVPAPSTLSSITTASDTSASSISSMPREPAQASRRAGGTHDMDQLMQDMRGLDAEIAALEASMQSVASSVGV